MSSRQLLRVAHISDLHVSHVTSNLVWLKRLLRPGDEPLSPWDLAVRLAVSSWSQRRSLIEPLLRASHLMHQSVSRHLVAVVQSVRQQGADHLVLTGDLANLGAASEFREVMHVLRAFGFEEHNLTVVPGNHDVLNVRGAGEFEKHVCSRPYPLLNTLGEQLAIVAVDSTAKAADLDWRDVLTINSRGLISVAALEAADKLLAAAPAGAFKILCCHHHLVDLPPDGYVDGWSGRLDPRLTGKAENADALLDIACARGVGLILFGHRHQATHNAFMIRSVPAACSGAVTYPGRDGLLRYRMFDIQDGQLVGRRWIEVSPEEANRDMVRAVTDLSATRDPDALRLTADVRLDRLEKDLRRVHELRRELDRKVLKKIGNG